jgi:TubC N-terminal docking domain
MSAAQVLEGLHVAGFALSADGDRLTVTPGGKLTEADRQSIRAHKSELLALLRAAPRPVEPPTVAANDAGGPSTTADAMAAPRLARMACVGWSEVRALATVDRLRTRDRQEDDRRMCIECTHLGDTGRCLAAATGRLCNADRRYEPVPDLLQRCEAFGLRKGLA